MLKAVRLHTIKINIYIVISFYTHAKVCCTRQWMSTCVCKRVSNYNPAVPASAETTLDSPSVPLGGKHDDQQIPAGRCRIKQLDSVKTGDFIPTLVVGRWLFLQPNHVVPRSVRCLLRIDGRTDGRLQRSRECHMSRIPSGSGQSRGGRSRGSVCGGNWVVELQRDLLEVADRLLKHAEAALLPGN